jgi:hypothetical protein
MSFRTRCSGAVVMAAILSLVAISATTTASAQSPCATQQVVNNSPCPFTLNLYDAFGNQGPPFVIAAGPGVATTISLPGTFVPVGVVDAYGNQQPFVAPPKPGCTSCMRISFAIVCCASICYDQAACLFTVTPCPLPC